MPSFDKSTTDLIALVGVCVGALALLLALAAVLRLRRLRADYDLLQGDGARESFVEALLKQRATVDTLRQEVGTARQEVAVARSELADSIRHVAVMRYDAFADMGGRLSFSAALLDDAGDGIVITSINGRSETRTYAKGVKSGSSEHTLSPEEQQAIAYAQGQLPSRGSRKPPRRGAPAEEPPPDDSGSVEGFTVLP